MGIHSDSIYKDTQREVEAKKVDTEELLSTILPDDEKLHFGDDKDFYIQYNSDTGRLRIANVDDTQVISIESGTGGADTIHLTDTVFDGLSGSGGGSSIGKVTILGLMDDSQIALGADDDVTAEYDSGNDKLKVGGACFVDETADGMTADPEADTEDGFLIIEIGTTVYQIPIYLS